MKKHRTLWVIIIVIVVLAAAAAGVWFWLQSRLDETQQAHQTVYAEYQAMTAAADQVTLTVTEDGSAIGSYDMQALGLRDDLLQKVNAQFSEIDRMPDAQFAALPLKERLDWAKLGLKPAATVSPDLGQLDLSAVLADLQSVKRTAAQDAYIDLVDGVYTVHEEVAGDELNAAAVQEGLQTAAAGLAVTPSGAQNATFELTSVDCSEAPAITTATLPIRPTASSAPRWRSWRSRSISTRIPNSCRTARRRLRATIWPPSSIWRRTARSPSMKRSSRRRSRSGRRNIISMTRRSSSIPGSRA